MKVLIRVGQTFSIKGRIEDFIATGDCIYYINSLASGCFRGFSKKKHLNACGFAREYLRSCSGYGPGRSVKRRGKSSSLHSKKDFCLGGTDVL